MISLPELRHIRQLKEENLRLKKLVADLSLDKAMLQDVLEKKEVTLAGLREWIRDLQTRCGTSGRQIYLALQVSCSSYRYRSVAADDSALHLRIKEITEFLYLGVKAVGGYIETCCNAGNRMTTINNLFDCFNFKLFRITLTAHGHLSLSHLK